MCVCVCVERSVCEMKKYNTCMNCIELCLEVGGVRGQRSLMITAIYYFNEFEGEVASSVVYLSLPHSVLVLFGHLDQLPCLQTQYNTRERKNVCNCTVYAMLWLHRLWLHRLWLQWKTLGVRAQYAYVQIMCM